MSCGVHISVTFAHTACGQAIHVTKCIVMWHDRWGCSPAGSAARPPPSCSRSCHPPAPGSRQGLSRWRDVRLPRELWRHVVPRVTIDQQPRSLQQMMCTTRCCWNLPAGCCDWSSHAIALIAGGPLQTLHQSNHRQTLRKMGCAKSGRLACSSPSRSALSTTYANTANRPSSRLLPVGVSSLSCRRAAHCHNRVLQLKRQWCATNSRGGADD